MFTREQLLAISIDRHLIVSAGAGSGKTKVLVERYIQLLLQGVSPKQIVAITFTKKAAAEMLSRIANELDKRYQGADYNELYRLRKIIEQLASAKISTIHSFCSQLLRDFPIEAEIAPNFGELPESELTLLIKDEIRKTLESALEDVDTAPLAKKLIINYGYDAVEAFLTRIIKNKEKFITLKDLYDSGDDVFIHKVISQSKSAVSKIVKQIQPTLNMILMYSREIEVMKLMGKKPSITPKDSLEIYMRERKTLTAYSENSINFVELTKETNTNLKNILSGLLDSKKQPRGKLREICDGITAKQWIELAEAKDFIDDFDETLSNIDADYVLLSYGRIIVTLADKIQANIEAIKNEKAGVTFDDMQIKAVALLRNDHVRAILKRRIKYLMMDEFQDTNRLQYELAVALVEALKGKRDSIADEPNIFIVGDAKQSIYGFRNADVRVFEEARADIMSANTKALQDGLITDIMEIGEYGNRHVVDDELVGNIQLSASFRMVPNLVAIVNKICSVMMPEVTQGYEVGYEEMISGRREESNLIPTIELICSPKYSTRSSDYSDKIYELNRLAQRETDSLAERIIACVEGDTPLLVWDEHSKSKRKAEWKDIAVLYRKKTEFNSLANSFREYGIPHSIYSGSGYYTTIEISDMISFLTMIHNPYDDVAVLSVLRSPFFGFDDTILFEVCTSVKQESVWGKLEYCIQEQNTVITDIVRLRDSYNIIRRLIDIAPTVSIAELINEILDATNWYSKIRYTESRLEQSYANIEKMIQKAREYQAKGLKNLYDYVEELEWLIESGDKEEEAQLRVEENVVSVMTFHASKGLEFPIVFLAGLNSGSGNKDLMMIDEDFGIVLPVSKSKDNKSVTPMTYLSKKRVNEAEKAEDKRLLYVAMTRAKEHLFFSASITINIDKDGNRSIARPKSYLALIDSGLGLELSSNDINLINRTIEYELDVQRLVDNARIHEKVLCTLEYRLMTKSNPFVKDKRLIARSSSVNDTNNQEQVLASATPLVMIGNTQQLTYGEVFSATQLMLFARNPYEYLRQYRLGLPPSEDEKLSSHPGVATDDSDAIKGTMAGNLIHEVLSTIGQWLSEKGVEKETLELSISRALHNQNVVMNTALLERVRREVLNIAYCNLIQENLRGVRSAKTEYNLLLPLGSHYMNGSIDMMIEMENGDIEVWDWKTNSFYEKNMDDYLEVYRLQMEIYCWMIAIMYPEKDTFKARLIFTRLASKTAPIQDYSRVVEFKRRDIGSLESRLNSMIQSIHQLCGLTELVS
jgi:ATP-dependent helicase/nuclease subunit A